MRQALILPVTLLAAASAMAQVPQGDSDTQEEQVTAPLPEPLRPLERPAVTLAGTAGERQTRQEAAGIEPLDRLDTRIESRVESRLRNRIDRYYNPQDNAAASIAAAEAQVRGAGRRRR